MQAILYPPHSDVCKDGCLGLTLSLFSLSVVIVIVRFWDRRLMLRDVSRLGLVVRRSVGKRKDAGSTPGRFGSPFSYHFFCDFMDTVS